MKLIDFVDMKYSLRQLEIFVAIARAENVSRAAQQLKLSQSAASSALVELERMFERPLFDRIGKSLHLNSTGRGLLDKAEALLIQAGDIETYLSGGGPGPLAIGATLTIGNYLATLIVVEYMRRYPDSPVRLQVANTAAIAERLLRFQCDFALLEGEFSHSELLLEPWLADELVIFCAPQHPLATATAVDNATLARQFWILREAGSGTRTRFEQGIRGQLHAVRAGLELEHTEAIKRAVESGLGIGCLSRLALREAFRRGSLQEIPTPQFDFSRQFYFACHASRRDSNASRLFRILCREMTENTAHTAQIQLPYIP
ncbi:LysR substrate-binding domain-containing protein [Azonexus sp.]|uniref:LysR substrate-binding domain-containing protein n=1 Tax=Azonexus sp. TaxID=1872668 RepID=UPI0039E39378